ncbi:MAG: orotidine 5'-phosphate decarboxylase [Acidobacteria bacterium RIFCSPLOWO2_02_FULL_61_28]|nr:MAG: orotidine 5'-phosphate decarboxylase [Acidobacteria bacterium RIFCSPLOWO2_02_FULL_61_28]
MKINARERLIVALDVPTAEEAQKLVAQFEGVVSFFKVGLELYTATGPELVRLLVSEGKKVFLDLKFLDIGETVRRATEQAARLGASFLTVHESGKAVAAAVQGRQGTDLKILAVTVLTSLDTSDLQAMGLTCSVEELVLARAQKAMEAGCHGVIASGQEAQKIREMAGDQLLIVTPGIRPSGTSAEDQKRTAAPAEAVRAGADYLVVGRPVTRAPNPREAAIKILEEMQKAFDLLRD